MIIYLSHNNQGRDPAFSTLHLQVAWDFDLSRYWQQLRWCPLVFSTVRLLFSPLWFYRDTLKLCNYLVPHQTIHLFISGWTYGFLFYSMGYNLLLLLFILMLKLSPVWLVGVPPRGPLYPFEKCPSFFEYFLAFWHNKMFQVYLVLFLSLSCSQTLSKEMQNGAILFFSLFIS